MVYDSLTEVPRNLKEGIDWLMALKRTDGENSARAMGAALYNFLVDKPVGKMEVPALEKVKSISKEFMEQREISDYSYVKDMLERYTTPMNKTSNTWWKSLLLANKSDYKNVINSWGVTGETIARDVDYVAYGCLHLLDNIKYPETYTSAYSSEATWETSCAKDPEACAVVFVGIAPMLYAGLLSLVDAMRVVIWRSDDNTKKRLADVLKAVGYADPECNTTDIPFVLRGLRYVDRELLDKLYDLAGFWAFY